MTSREGSVSWEDVIVELERATERLLGTQADDFPAVAQAMNARSAAVARLSDFARQASEPLTPLLLDRLRKDFTAGAAFTQRLLLARAAAHAEFSRVVEGSFMVRSLRNGRTGGRQLIDCEG
jgi:hypothetical protein